MGNSKTFIVKSGRGRLREVPTIRLCLEKFCFGLDEWSLTGDDVKKWSYLCRFDCN